MASAPKVVFDTNMLLSCGELKVDVLEEARELVPGARLITTKSVKKELGKLAKKSAKNRRNAGIARMLMKAGKVGAIGAEEADADKELLALSRKGYLIATNDKELRRKIRKAGKRSMTIRKKKFMIIQ